MSQSMIARSATGLLTATSLRPASMRLTARTGPMCCTGASAPKWMSSNGTASSNSAARVLTATIRIPRRGFATSSIAKHGDISRPKKGTGIKFTFQNAKGTEVTEVEGNEGDDLLSLAHEWNVDLEGACEGSIACSTCHVILSPEHYDKLEEPSDDENDMLDLAFGLSDTSRLGCQVHLTKDMEGMTATLPSATRNMYIDGHKPTPH